MPNAITEVILLKDGPILFLNERSKVAICRCGQTENEQGLCDGTHAKCGFKAKQADIKLGEHISLEVAE